MKNLLKQQSIQKIQKTVLLFALSLMMASSLLAQSSMADMTSEEKAQAITEKQNQAIHFSDTQAQQMYNINLKYIKEMEKAYAAGGRSISTRNKLKSLDGQKDNEVKKVLDNEQYKVYQEKKKEIREQMKAQMSDSKH
ncbi:MAG: hypothetical protein SFV52_07135 [Saprospiraceae bacterium]|nr:hypothetical protein [Saprospiraceae bacterium]